MQTVKPTREYSSSEINYVRENFNLKEKYDKLESLHPPSCCLLGHTVVRDFERKGDSEV